MRPMRLAVVAACLAGSLAVPAGALAADQIAGVTDDNQLELFRSDAPGNVEYTVPVSGLPAGEKIVGLDRRPATGALYALGSSSRIYRVDPSSGQALSVGDPFSPLLDGANFGFTVNPVADLLRSVSDARQNLRINPTTGQVLAAETPLQYAAGDAGAGTTPSVIGASYTNKVPGATSTTLYDIDQGRDTLVTQNPANDGTLTTVGALGVDVTGPGGFSVAPSGVAYAALRPAGQASPQLYTVNLTTGAATAIGAIATRPSNTQTGTHPVVAIAALDPVADDRSAPNVVVDLSSTLLETTLLSRGVPIKVACDEACSVSTTAKVFGTSTTLGTVTGDVVGGAGLVNVSIPMSASDKTLIQRPGTLRLSVLTTIKDSAGNTRTTGRVIRTQTLSQRLHG
jgi:Domain of unknown function (DUF4394)